MGRLWSGRRARARWRLLAVIVLIACVITPVFNLLTVSFTLRSAVQGVLDACLIGFLAGGFLIFIRDGALRPWFRRRRFLADLALSSAIMLMLFLVGRAIGQVITTSSPAYW